MKKSSVILGIDPGTRITGYGLIVFEGGRLQVLDYGCIRPKASLPLTAKYRVIFEGIAALVKEYAPEALSVETQFVGQHVPTAIKLGMARGVATLAASLHEIPVFEYPPAKAKRAVTGTGRASKGQVQAMVRHLLTLKEVPEPEDAADALALAICHANASRHGWQNECRI